MTGRRSTRRARPGTELITIYWRDIPAQVTGRSGGEKVAVELSSRFQVAIDRAAAVADKVKYDEYIGEWRREATPCSDDIQAEANALAARLEAEFTRERIAGLVANGGFAEPPDEPRTIDEEGGRS